MSTLRQAPRTTIRGPASHDGRALARCVADPDGFASAWGTRALLATAAALPQPFDDLLDLEAVDEILSRRGLRTPFLRMAKDGVVVDPARYTRSGGAGAAIADQVDDSAVTKLFAGGTTIVLQALHRIWPPLIAFAGELTEELGHPVQVNAYVTPPSSRGFSAHYDIHDVFVLQVAGEKRWIVHEPVHEWPLRSQPWTQHRTRVERAVEAPPLLDAVLRPGDALYLPRGFLHAAEALGDVSVHLTVGIHVVTRRALLDALLAQAEDEPELRRALPVGVDLTDPEALTDEISATVEVLSSRFRDLDPDAAARRLGRDLTAASRPSPISPLGQVEASGRVESAMRIQLRVGLPIRIDVDDRVTTLHHQGSRLEFDATLGNALAVIATGEPRTVGSLPGDEAAVADLVRMLLVHGVVVLAD